MSHPPNVSSPPPISPQDTNISLLPRFSLAPWSRQQTNLAQSSFQSPIPFPSSSLTYSLIPLLPCLQPPIAPSYSPSRNNHSPPSCHHLTPLFWSVPTSPNASHPEPSPPAGWASVPSPKPTQDHAHLPSSQLLKQHSFLNACSDPFHPSKPGLGTSSSRKPSLTRLAYLVSPSLNLLPTDCAPPT